MHDAEFLMIVLVVAIGCAAGVAKAGLNVLKAFLDQKVRLEELRLRNGEASLGDMLRGTREEMAQLHRTSTDVILTFDATLQRLDQRIQNLERQTLSPGSSAPVAVAARPVAPAVASTNGAMPATDAGSALSDGGSLDR